MLDVDLAAFYELYRQAQREGVVDEDIKEGEPWWYWIEKLRRP